MTPFRSLRLLCFGFLSIGVPAIPATAQTALWLPPGPSVQPHDWTDAANWDTAVVPDSPEAVAVVRAYTLGSVTALLNATQSNAAPIFIRNADVTLGELRYQMLDGGGTQTSWTIELGNLASDGTPIEAGSLRLEGAGITVATSTHLGFGAFIRILNGSLTLADQAGIGGGINLVAAPAAAIEFLDQSSGGSVRIDTTEIDPASLGPGPGTAIAFRDQSTAGNANIRLGRGAVLEFSGQATAGHSTITFLPVGDAMLCFAGESTGANATVSGSFGSFLGNVEFVDDADGGQIILVNIDRLDISGAVTAQGATGRMRSTSPGTDEPSVVADDARIVSVESAIVRELRLGSNTLRIGGGTIHHVTDHGVYLSAAGENLTGGGLLKTGPGTLTLLAGTGPSPAYAVPLTVEGGTVQSAAPRLGTTTILPQGRLILGGDVDGELTNQGQLDLNYGSTRAVAGAFTQSASGTLKLVGFTFDPAAVSTHVLEIDGAATLAGMLELGGLSTPLLPLHTLPASRLLLTAEAVSGQFGALAVNTPPRLQVTPRYEPDSVHLDYQVLSFADFAATPAGAAFGRHLDANELRSGNPDAFDALVLRLDSLPDANAIGIAIEALAPDRHGLLAEEAFQAAMGLRTVLDRQLELARHAGDHRLAAFFHAGARNGRFDATDGIRAARSRTRHGTAGLLWTGGGGGIGAFLGAENRILNFGTSVGRAETDRVLPGLMAQYRLGRFFLNGSTAFSREKHDLRRRISFSGFEGIAAASPSGRRNDLGLATGYALTAGTWTLTPSLGALASRFRTDAFTETGAAGADLTIEGIALRSTRLHAGLDAAWRSSGGRCATSFAVTWWHENEKNSAFPARFPSVGMNYVAPGRERERSLLQASLGLSVSLGRAASLHALASGTRGRNSNLNADLSAGCGWRF